MISETMYQKLKKALKKVPNDEVYEIIERIIHDAISSDLDTKFSSLLNFFVGVFVTFFL